MRLFLAMGAALALTGVSEAQILSEDFDGGSFPPAGWTVVDNNGNGSWDTSSVFPRGNVSGGSGECAAFDSLIYGMVVVDGELISPLFDLPAAGYVLEFDHAYVDDSAGAEIGDIDIRIGGGAWTNLARYTFFDNAGHKRIALDAYSGGTNLQLRFHYYFAFYGECWQVDNVQVLVPPPPPAAIWEEDFDGGVFPPPGWTVVDNLGNGTWDSSSAFPHGNQTDGSGECASIDSDYYGWVDIDGELITPAFDVPVGGGTFDYYYLFNHGGPDGANVDLRVGGGAWTNLVSYAVDDSGRESIDLGAWAGTNGVQVRFHYHAANTPSWYWDVDEVGLYLPPEPGAGFCPGDGVAPHTPCPCGNDNDGSMGGCRWDLAGFPSGAVLTATGSNSVAANDTYLAAESVTNNLGLFFEAANRVNGGDGNPFGDGLRCAGGALIRLIPPTPAVGHQASCGPIQSLGNALPGDTKRYQYWFRSPSGPCSTDFNLSNGYEILWGS